MATVRIEYLGDLRTRCTHEKSGTEIITDAPTDNHGKGESFSPTDLIGTSFVSCILTVVGIHCNQNDIEMKGGTGVVDKIMTSGPRRIEQLKISLDFSMNDWSAEIQERIKRVAEGCPVAHSVSETMIVDIDYTF